MILPPRVVVVLNHASVVKVSGPVIALGDETRLSAVPLNVVAVSASPITAPAAPRVTPVPTTPSMNPAQS